MSSFIPRDLVQRIAQLRSQRNAFRYAMRRLMEVAYQRGWTAERFIRWARENGISYRRQEMLEDWREVVGRIEIRQRLKYVPKDKKPDYRRFPVARHIRGGDFLFRCLAQFECRTPYGVYYTTDYVSFATTVVKTRAEIEFLCCKHANERRVEVCVREVTESCDCECMSAQVVEALRRADIEIA